MFKDLYYYKENADDVFYRMNKMYDDAVSGRGGNILFRILLDSDVDIYSSISINKYNFETDIEKYAKDVCKVYEQSFELHRTIMDDTIPTLSPILGIGDYSAFVGGEIYFSKDTSWSKPILNNISDFKKLEKIGTSKWYKRFLDICENIIILSKGSGIPFIRGFFSPLDLAAALRGEKIYTDFYDDPDGVHELLSFCADATIKFAEDIYSIARKHIGRDKYGMWFLEGAINMSEDIACMISGDTYRTFAAPYTQKVIDHFGRGFMHTHSRALYMVEEISRLDNVANIWIATDPNQPRPVEHLDELVEVANGVCLSIDCESIEEIENSIKSASKGNVSYCLPVSSVEEGLEALSHFSKIIERNGIL